MCGQVLRLPLGMSLEELPPDGASYLGSIFARALQPAQAEAALRSAHRCLRFDIRTEILAVAAPDTDAP